MKMISPALLRLLRNQVVRTFEIKFGSVSAEWIHKSGINEGFKANCSED